ncbi:MAG: TIGR01777 family oxidoreductase [Nitrospirales bacterium]
MKIVIAGGTGFVGQHVSRLLLQEGHSVIVLSRHAERGTPVNPSQPRHIQWDGCSQGSWSTECVGADVVINLSGAPIADKRWTPSRKRELIDSRVVSTRTLGEAIGGWATKPHTFLTASGVGYYGPQGATIVDETSPRGDGFLADLCLEWEDAAQHIEALGLRVLEVRFGMVLGTDGGALPKMMLPFHWFLGGPILPGTQYVSWIHQEDLARLILFLITHSPIRGPVNAVAPEDVTMKDFCQALGKAMNRPSWFPVPEFALRIALGELSTMLTTGQRAQPHQALSAGFSFTYSTIQEAMHAIVSQRSA